MLCAFVFLLWSHVDANSQTIPYMTFMGETLPNNSYIDLSLVRDRLSGGEGVQCHTDLTTCCSSDQGMDQEVKTDCHLRVKKKIVHMLFMSTVGIRVLPCFKGALQSVNLLVYIAVI